MTAAPDSAQRFRMPVQWVNRPNGEFRGYAGTVSSGVLSVGQPIRVLPGGRCSRIASIVTADALPATAVPGQAVTVTLTDEVDVSRGDVLVPADDPLEAVTGLTARLLWMAEEPLSTGQSLMLKLGTTTANVRIERFRHAIDVHSFEPREALSLTMNEIAVADLTLDRPVVTEDYVRDRELGAFVLIDRMTNQTVALGVVGPAVASGHSVPEASRRPELAWPRDQGQRLAFFRGLLSPALNAAALWGIVMALSSSATLASIVSLAEVVLRPVLDRFARSV